MQIQTDVSLKAYSTMRLGDDAKALAEVHTKEELQQAVAWAQQRGLPVLPIGRGSNIIFSDGYPGLVIVNRITGYEVTASDATSVTIQVGAGEEWDSVVERSVQANLHGIELLSAIPGTAGATPVQNVGAYGCDIAETFVELEAFDLKTSKFVTFNKAACQFDYRNSIFKLPEHKHYIITSITLRLHKNTNPQPPFYASLQSYLDQQGITEYTPQAIRQAVIAVRKYKLPDPSHLPNTGSFFENPIVPAAQAEQVITKFPDAKYWQLPDGRYKFAAGWLIERAGLKGYASHGMKTYEHHALVLVNDHAHNYQDLLAFKSEIVTKVKTMFGIELKQEPELL